MIYIREGTLGYRGCPMALLARGIRQPQLAAGRLTLL